MVGSFLIRLGRAIASKFRNTKWARPIQIRSPGPSITSTLPYEPLGHNKRKYRILTLLGGQRDSPILCHLEQASLDSGERYEALSYRWTTTGRPRIIQLNGSAFPISENLWLALHRFRLPENDRKLWVDQICINQSDDLEKSYQVGHMGSIYSQAKQVLLWLGPGSTDTSLAMKALTALHQGDHGTTAALRIRHSRPWRAVMNLVEEPYWNRVWIIREISLASSKTVYCGDEELSWEAFSSFLRGQNSGIAQRSRSVPAINRHNLVIVRPAPAVALAHLNLDRTLLTQLVQFRYALQTDPRDKIYAFSTLTNDLGIFPDYSKSVQEVYLNATVAQMKRYQSLDIICQSYFGQGRLSLPTWVPDWTMTSGPRPLLYDTYGRSQGLMDLKTKPAEIKVDVGRGTLHVKGLQIDTLREVRQPLEDVADISGCLGDWASTLASQKIQPRARNDLTQLYMAAMEKMSLAASSRPRRGPEGRSSRYNLPKDWLLGDKLKAINHLSKIVFRRRLFLTQDNWWGIGPSNAQEGDLVCLLQGCDLPVQLRNEGDHFIFVGEIDIRPTSAYPAIVQDFVNGQVCVKDFSLR